MPEEETRKEEATTTENEEKEEEKKVVEEEPKEEEKAEKEEKEEEEAKKEKKDKKTKKKEKKEKIEETEEEEEEEKKPTEAPAEEEKEEEKKEEIEEEEKKPTEAPAEEEKKEKKDKKKKDKKKKKAAEEKAGGESSNSNSGDDETIHESAIIRREGCKELVDSLDGMKTVQEVFKFSLKNYGALESFGARPRDPATDKPTGDFEYITYMDFAALVGKFGRGLSRLYAEVDPDRASRPVEVPEDTMRIVGLYSINRIEWSVGDMACANYGFVSVPLYDTLGPDAVMKIILEADVRVALCSKDKAQKLMDMAEKIPPLKAIIQMEPVDEDTAKKAAAAGIKIVSYADTLASGEEEEKQEQKEKEEKADSKKKDKKKKSKKGEEKKEEEKEEEKKEEKEKEEGEEKEKEKEEEKKEDKKEEEEDVDKKIEKLLAGSVKVQPDDFHTIIYTSGTSGGAKGVIIRNRSFIAGIAGTIFPLRPIIKFREERFLSFLPLAHVLERQVFIIALYYGARVGYFSGHISGLMNDLQTLHPTVFFGVPRLFNKVYLAFQDKLAEKGWFARKVFSMAFNRKAAAIEATPKGTPPQWTSWVDSVFSQIRNGLGGSVKMILTGSAPLTPEIHRFLQVCFSCPVLQGYGMSEAYPVSVTDLNDPEPLHCGPIMPHCEIKLRDCPQLGYRVSDKPHPRGEAMIRGTHTFYGYYRNPAATAAALTEDGWYCTGDVVELIEGNRIRVIGRCKEVIKLAQGEFVVIEEVENMYALCPLVECMFVYGDPTRDFLVGVVVPEQTELMKWWNKNGGGGNGDGDGDASFETVCKDPKTKKMLLDALIAQHKASGMTGINRIHDIYVEHIPFSTDNGLLTPTNKLSRVKVKSHYMDIINQMYTRK